MLIDVLTIFPEYLAPLRQSLLGRALDRGVIGVRVHDPREWTSDPHRTIDDAPYGGGPGMVMRPEPWGLALDEVCAGDPPPRVVVPTPAGTPFTQASAVELSGEPRLVFACGRYEGIDDRVVADAREKYRVDELSIGDYVLAGGEAAVLVMVEAVTRLLPGVVGNVRSVAEDSFADGLLEGPSYTRPASWRGRDVPEVLRSGDHAAIARWRRDQALRRTASRRPDLLEVMPPEALDDRDREVLAGAGFHLSGPDVAP